VLKREDLLFGDAVSLGGFISVTPRSSAALGDRIPVVFGDDVLFG